MCIRERYADVTFYYITGRGDDRLVQHIDFSQRQPAGNNAGDEASLKEFTETIESKGQYLLHTLGGKLFVPSGEPLENYRVVTEGNVLSLIHISPEESLYQWIMEKKDGTKDVQIIFAREPERWYRVTSVSYTTLRLRE